MPCFFVPGVVEDYNARDIQRANQLPAENYRIHGVRAAASEGIRERQRRRETGGEPGSRSRRGRSPASLPAGC